MDGLLTQPYSNKSLVLTISISVNYILYIFTKHLLTVSVQELHNELIKPGAQGGFTAARDEAKGWVLSDTALRALMPRNLVPMTDSHMQLCGCETCIIAKSLTITLNGWCTRYHNSLVNDAGKAANRRGRNWKKKKRDLLQKAGTVKAFSKAEDGTAKHKHPRDFVAATFDLPKSGNWK